MEEINNFQQEPDENLYQAWERFKELLMKCPQYYLTEMQEVVLFYNGLDVPTRQILDSRGAIPSKTVDDAKTAIQEMAEYSQKWHNGTSRARRTMAGVDIDTLTMEQYLALSRENQAPGVVKSKIGGNVNFEIKSQFMPELREDTLSGNKDEDAHDHIDRVPSIIGLFNILGVTKDAIML
ncbi:hypothetical protein Tco_0938562 [Tanacetum coccineum]|uniref:Retrotransposon gag domain-containing protein n=1 Tax=Tanacetum coccineum TaxID=301880 RepID=A0ABQ5DI63_9ASTR